METGEKSADRTLDEMEDTNRRQLSPDQRTHTAPEPSNTYLSYDVINDYTSHPSPQSVAVVDWPYRPQADQLEQPVWVVPYREPILAAGSPVLVTPTDSVSRLYEDDWTYKKLRRGRRRPARLIDLDEQPRSCIRECTIYFGGFVILAIALAATIAIVYTYNSKY